MKSPRSRQLVLLVPCLLLFTALKPTATPSKAGSLAAELQSQPAPTPSAYTHIPASIWVAVIENIVASHNGLPPDKIIPAGASIATADTLVWKNGTSAQYFIQDKNPKFLPAKIPGLFTSYLDSAKFKSAYAKLVKSASTNGYKVKDSLRQFKVFDSAHGPYIITIGSVSKVTQFKNAKGASVVKEEIVIGVIHNPNY